MCVCVCEPLSWLAREEVCSKKVIVEQRLEPSEGLIHENICGKIVPYKGISKVKGLEVSTSLVYWRNSKKAKAEGRKGGLAQTAGVKDETPTKEHTHVTTGSHYTYF